MRKTEKRSNTFHRSITGDGTSSPSCCRASRSKTSRDVTEAGVAHKHLGREGGAMTKGRLGVMGIGWWSDVLASSIAGSERAGVVAAYTGAAGKRAAFARRFGCLAAE